MNLRSSGKRKHGEEDEEVPRASKARGDDGQLALMEEVKKAAPTLFAKPGDLFECFLDYGDPCVLEYVGRNELASREVPFGGGETRMSPNVGWLNFKGYELPGATSFVRDLVGAWPFASYSPYNEEGEYSRFKSLLCLPPSKCGRFVKHDVGDEEGQQEGGADGEAGEVSEELLEQARAVALAIFASPGDRFAWTVNAEAGYTLLTYVGRNETPPEKLTSLRLPKGFRPSAGEYDKPQLGWLVFSGNKRQIEVVNRGIRSGLGAWPAAVYTHYDDEGQPIDGTLCIPPEKCGPLLKDDGTCFW